MTDAGDSEWSSASATGTNRALDEALDEGRRWIEACLGERFPSDNFRLAIRDGVLLCRLANVIQPGIVNVKKICTNQATFTWLENLNYFINACKQLGLRGSQLFDPTDVIVEESLHVNMLVGQRTEQKRQLRNVAITLYWLGRKANHSTTFTGPQLNLNAFMEIVHHAPQMQDGKLSCSTTPDSDPNQPPFRPSSSAAELKLAFLGHPQSATGEQPTSRSSYRSHSHASYHDARSPSVDSSGFDGQESLAIDIDIGTDEDSFGFLVEGGTEEGSQARVSKVDKGSPAKRVGLQVGDLLFWADGETVAFAPHKMVVQHLDACEKERHVTLGIQRQACEEPSTGIPLALVCQSSEARKIFSDAVRKGSIRVRRLRMSICGQFGVGKTSVKKSILNETFDSNEVSTEGIGISPSECYVGIGTGFCWAAGDVSLQDPIRIAQECLPEIEQLKQEKMEEKQMHQHVDEASDDKQLPVHTSALSSAPKTPAAAVQDEKLPVEEQKFHQEILAATAAGLNVDTVELTAIIQQLKDNPDVMNEMEEDKLQITIWDYAGQAVFYSILHLFMAYVRCIYLLVFKVNETYLDHGPGKGFLQVAPNTFRVKPHESKTCDVVTGMTDFDYILQWLSAIHYAGKREDDKQQGQLRPPVIVVATHADKAPLLRNDNLYTRLSELCQDVEAFKHVSMYKSTGVHLVNNCLSHKGKDPSKEVQHLREHIRHLANEVLSGDDQQVIPKTWLRFEKSLKVLKKQKIPWLELKQVLKIIKQVCEVDGEEQLVLLQFYHNLGLLVHFQKPEQLSNTVILDVQWLIDQLASVITVKLIKDTPPEQQKHWRRLEMYGELSEELTAMVWKDKLSPEMQKQFIGVMKEFDLLCEGSHSSCEDEEEKPFFLVPSVMMCETDPGKLMLSLDDDDVTVASMHDVPLIIQSADQQMPIPHSLYFRLIVRLLREWQRIMIKYNCVRFQYHDNKDDCTEFDVVLCHNALAGAIKIVVQWHVLTGDGGPEEDKEYFNSKPHRMAEVCNNVHKRVLQHLNEVCQPTMLQLKLMASVAALCHNCRKCKKHKHLDCCEEDDCAASMPVCERHKRRLCSNEACADDVSAALCELKKSAFSRAGTPCSKCKKPRSLPKNASCWVKQESKFQFPDTSPTVDKTCAAQWLVKSPDLTADDQGLDLGETAGRSFPDRATRVLRCVSGFINNRLVCIHLALQLGVDEELLCVIEDKMDARYDNADCHKMLCKWFSAKQGGLAILYHSLVEIKRTDVALRYKDALLGNEAASEEGISREQLSVWPMKKAILGIARSLNLEKCIDLGHELLGPGEAMSKVENLKSFEYQRSDAYDMLNSWLRLKRGNEGRKLYKALESIKQKQLAEEFQAALLSADAADGAHICSSSSRSREATDQLTQHTQPMSDALREWRSRPITNDHILGLEKTAVAVKWVRIARRLRREKPGSDAFTRAKINEIKKSNPRDDVECLWAMIESWLEMDLQHHTVGPFYDALVLEEFEAVAQHVFSVPPL